MKIAVCMKQVPAASEGNMDPETGVLIRAGLQAIVNVYDLAALEAALKIKETYGAEIHVFTMGPQKAESVLREAFAMGADEGFLICDKAFAGADVLATSYTLMQAIKSAGDYDLILCGKQTTDGDTAQVGPEIAEWLGIPSVANVRRIVRAEKGAVVVEADLPQSLETTRVQFPCLLSVDKDICQPRLPSYVKLCASRERPVTVLTLDDMDDRDERHYGLNGSPTQVRRIFPPESDVRREIWRGSGQTLGARLYTMLRQKKFV